MSHVLGGLVVVAVLLRGRFGLKLELALFWPRFDLLYRLLRISAPSGFDSLSVVVGQFWFLGIVNQFGDVASSAHGLALVWEGLGYLSGAAFGTAAMTLVGQNLGQTPGASRPGRLDGVRPRFYGDERDGCDFLHLRAGNAAVVF